MVRPSSQVWAWFRITTPKGDGKTHPDVQCRFCPKHIANAMVSRNLIPHAVRCVGAPAEVLMEAKRLRNAAKNKQQGHASPGRSASRRLSLTPTRQHRSGLGTQQSPNSTLFVAFDVRDAESVRTQIAWAIFSASLPVRVVENKVVKILLQALAPPGGVSCRQSVATSLLDRVFASVKVQSRALVGSQEFLTIVTDGWTDQSNRGMINFVLVAPGMRPVFWKSVATGESQHTGDYYKTMTENFIIEVEVVIGRDKIICVNSDNASNIVVRSTTRNLDDSVARSRLLLVDQKIK